MKRGTLGSAATLERRLRRDHGIEQRQGERYACAMWVRREKMLPSDEHEIAFLY